MIGQGVATDVWVAAQVATYVAIPLSPIFSSQVT